MFFLWKVRNNYKGCTNTIIHPFKIEYNYLYHPIYEFVKASVFIK